MSMDNLIAPKSSRNKMRSFDENMKKYFEEKDYKENIERQDRDSEENYQREKINNSIQESYNARLHSKNRERIKTDIAIQETYQKVVPVLFASLVYRSLPLDEDFKANNVKYIYKQSTGLFNNLMAAGAIKMNTKEPSTFKEMCESIAVAMSDTETPETLTVGSVINKALTDNPTESDDLIKTVRDKVVNAVADEKKAITLKEKIIKEGKYLPEDKSLFRSIHEANIHYVMQENSSLDKKSVMDLSLAESMLDYTLLETLHTCKLIKFDFLKINNAKKFISK